jgi:hypothetical protein
MVVEALSQHRDGFFRSAFAAKLLAQFVEHSRGRIFAELVAELLDAVVHAALYITGPLLRSSICWTESGVTRLAACGVRFAGRRFDTSLRHWGIEALRGCYS